MAAQAVAAGISAVVATPHVGNSVYSPSLQEILTSTDRLQSSLRESGIPLQVYPGAEVHLIPRLSEMAGNRQIATINHGPYLLLELPDPLLLDSCKLELFNLRMKGFMPIIAHPERNTYLQRHQEFIMEMLEMGALCQITAQSLLGDFGVKTQKFAEKMVKNRAARVLASDAHAAFGSRVPGLAEATERAARILGNHEEANAMVGAIPRAIVTGREIKAPAPQKERGRRTLRSIFAPAAM